MREAALCKVNEDLEEMQNCCLKGDGKNASKLRNYLQRLFLQESESPLWVPFCFVCERSGVATVHDAVFYLWLGKYIHRHYHKKRTTLRLVADYLVKHAHFLYAPITHEALELDLSQIKSKEVAGVSRERAESQTSDAFGSLAGEI